VGSTRGWLAGPPTTFIFAVGWLGFALPLCLALMSASPRLGALVALLAGGVDAALLLLSYAAASVGSALLSDRRALQLECAAVAGAGGPGGADACRPLAAATGILWASAALTAVCLALSGHARARRHGYSGIAEALVLAVGHGFAGRRRGEPPGAAAAGASQLPGVHFGASKLAVIAPAHSGGGGALFAEGRRYRRLVGALRVAAAIAAALAAGEAGTVPGYARLRTLQAVVGVGIIDALLSAALFAWLARRGRSAADAGAAAIQPRLAAFIRCNALHDGAMALATLGAASAIAALATLPCVSSAGAERPGCGARERVATAFAFVAFGAHALSAPLSFSLWRDYVAFRGSFAAV